MSAAKDRGDRFERDVVRVLRANGWPHAERTLRLGASDDRGDIDGLPGFHLDCKDQPNRDRLGAWMTEVVAEAATITSRPIPAVIVKRRGVPTERAFVVVELATFARLIAEQVTVP